MPFDTDTTSKGSMDGSKVPESCPESQAPAAEASFQSKDILDKLFPKYQQCKAGKMSFGGSFPMKYITDHKAYTKFKSEATEFYRSVSEMAIPGLHAQEYRNTHYTASKNYAELQNSAIFKSVIDSVKSEMNEDFQAASCFGFRQICGPGLSLPDTPTMRKLASDHLGVSDVILNMPSLRNDNHDKAMNEAVHKARQYAPTAQTTVSDNTTDGSSNEAPSSPQTSIASNNTLKPE